jgi:relaxase-like protein
VCQYVCDRNDYAIVLEVEGVRPHDHELMARDFETIHSLREERSMPVFHAVIDFHRDEHPDDPRMVKIARDYLRQIGLVETQYAVVKHLDTAHDHLHIVANRIGYDGNLIQLYPELLRNKDVVRDLVREYGLIPAGKKDLRQTNFDALDNSETRKYAIFRSIQQCLPGCRDLDELEQRLFAQGVETRYRVDQQTGQRIGISFRYQEESFKGSDIDRDYSFQRLATALGQRQQLSQWESEKLVLGKAQDRDEQLARELAQRREEELRQRQVRRHTQAHSQGHKLGLY